MMKRALLVGIDHYDNFPPLYGCANDAAALEPLLAHNEDGSPNLECRLAVASDAATAVGRDELLQMIDQLLAPGATFALLYFAGHGAQTPGGGVALATSDGTETSPGVQFSEILARINLSQVDEITVIIDSCFSGGATTIEALNTGLANLRNGLAVLTASRGDEVSVETADARGQFSTYLQGALDAGAADVLGRINVSGLYAALSESFGAWDQRPTFKANIDRLHEIRTVRPKLPLPMLRNITTWFPTPDYVLPLNPTFEPSSQKDQKDRHPNTTIFSGLQRYRASLLLEPVGEDHMYYAAMHYKSCRLTPLGRHYWNQVKAERI
jgi:hypothetical protein